MNREAIVATYQWKPGEVRSVEPRVDKTPTSRCLALPGAGTRPALPRWSRCPASGSTRMRRPDLRGQNTTTLGMPCRLAGGGLFHSTGGNGRQHNPWRVRRGTCLRILKGYVTTCMNHCLNAAPWLFVANDMLDAGAIPG